MFLLVNCVRQMVRVRGRAPFALACTTFCGSRQNDWESRQCRHQIFQSAQRRYRPTSGKVLDSTMRTPRRESAEPRNRGAAARKEIAVNHGKWLSPRATRPGTVASMIDGTDYIVIRKVEHGDGAVSRRIEWMGAGRSGDATAMSSARFTRCRRELGVVT